MASRCPTKGFKSGPLLIVAGAGTGKTDTLAHRVAHLVIHGVDPARILMLTFTRRAAAEMRRRAHDITKKALNEALGGLSPDASLQRLTWTGTFHSVGNRLLRHYARAPEARSAVHRHRSRRLRRPHGQRCARSSDLPARSSASRARKPACRSTPTASTRGAPLKETLEAAVPVVRAVGSGSDASLPRLRRAQAARKSSRLRRPAALLARHDGAIRASPQHVGGNFDHVLVDEYQDTNKLQAEILHALQARWRGARGGGRRCAGDLLVPRRGGGEHPRLSRPLRRRAPRSSPWRRTTAPRSRCSMSPTRVMAEAPRQHRKHLLSMRGDGRAAAPGDRGRPADAGGVRLQRGAEAARGERAAASARRCSSAASSHSDILEVELARGRFPFVKYGGLKFLEAAHIKDLLAVLRWADNPRNTLAAFRVAAAPARHGPGQRAPRRSITSKRGGGSFAALQSFTPPQAARDGLGASCSNCCRRLPTRSALARTGAPGARVVSAALRAALRAAPHAPRRSRPARAALRPVPLARALPHRAHPRSAERHQRSCRASRLLDEDYLVLSTIHSAKGMEWDTVYLLNVVDGSFPSEFATGKAELIEEERRLLYVA